MFIKFSILFLAVIALQLVLLMNAANPFEGPTSVTVPVSTVLTY